MDRVFLITGSNLGDSLGMLNRVSEMISEEVGKIIQKSQIYRSLSWGYESPALYLNQCLETETRMEPHRILDKILDIEMRMGRIRNGEGYSDREIDIDILFYGERVLNRKNLVIPHPKLHLRKFVLVPLNEIAGEFKHPVSGKTVSELLTQCLDPSVVVPY